MTLFESYPGMYTFTELPRFAAFLKTHHLEEVVTHQLQLSRQHSVPVLQFLTHLSDAQLIELSKASMIELFEALERNEASDYVRTSLERWLSDQLEIVGKLEITAEDITLISYIRRKSFKKWVPTYTNDSEKMLQLNDEIDLFFMGQDTSGVNTYINILKESITKKENQLLEAQAIAHLGSYEWDIVNDTSVSTPELRKIFGLRERQPYDAFLKSVHPDDVEKVKAAMSAALVTGTFTCEYRYLTPTEEKTLWTIGVVSYKNNQPVLMQGTVQDITDRKNIERELMRKTALLERSNESLQQFASVASHDLKEPLRKIATFTDVVLHTEGANLSEKSSANLQKVKDSSKRMQQMITDILSYSSIEGEEKEQVALQEVLMETAELLDQVIKDKAAVVQWDALPEIYADKAQMRQLFQNLLSNGLKFSKPGIPPVIQITHAVCKGKDLQLPNMDPLQDYVQIEVKDNGIGFDQAYAEKIFGLFNRLHGKAAYEGTGLGLSIARRIVENHNGAVTAQSTGDGATFTITLPLHKR